MEMTEVDIAAKMKGLNAQNRGKLSFYCLFILFVSLVSGLTIEYLFIKNLKNEMNLIKIEVQNLRQEIIQTNDTNFIVINETLLEIRKELASKLANISKLMEAMNIRMNDAQLRVAQIDYNTSSLLKNMSKIEILIEKSENLYNQSYYLTEISKIPDDLESLKSDVEHVNLKFNSVDDTIESLIRNTSDTRTEMKKVIQKQETLKLKLYDVAVALGNWNMSTKAEISDMKKEILLQWTNFTETVRILEQRVQYNANNVDYINQMLIDWKMMAISELTNITEGLKSLKIENLHHKMVNMDGHNNTRANAAGKEVFHHVRENLKNSSIPIIHESIEAVKGSNSSLGTPAPDQQTKLGLIRKNNSLGETASSIL